MRPAWLLGKPDHSEKEVTAFMDRHGKKVSYTFAYADDGAAAEAWLAAAGREGIPCTFVVDKAGRIAYIGHPLYLGVVLPKVVEGVATAKEVGAEMATIEAEFDDVSALLSRDPKAGLRSLKAFESKHLTMRDLILSARAKLSYLPKHGEAGEAKQYAEAFVAKAIKEEDEQALRMASSILRRGEGKENKELLVIAVKAAEAVVQIDGGKVAESLINLADSYFISGDKAKAREYAHKAVYAARWESVTFKRYIEKEAARLSGEK
jgi:hypothetical protein